jgi:hypothetical protein
MNYGYDPPVSQHAKTQGLHRIVEIVMPVLTCSWQTEPLNNLTSRSSVSQPFLLPLRHPSQNR